MYDENEVSNAKQSKNTKSTTNLETSLKKNDHFNLIHGMKKEEENNFVKQILNYSFLASHPT